MLEIVIEGGELYDETTEKIIRTKPVRLKLEHSLLSISKWESKWHIPFLKESEKTQEQFIDYVRCMTITQNVDPKVYQMMSLKTIKEVKAYIDDPMTATWFSKDNSSKRSNRIITSELVYCWMTQNQIPFECDKWNFNRLLTLIRVCSAENAPKKKMGNKKILSQNASLNAKRKQAMHTRG